MEQHRQRTVAATVARAMSLPASFWGRRRLPGVLRRAGAVAFFIVGSILASNGLAAQCSARAAAVAAVEQRLFAQPAAVSIYDANRGQWLHLAAETQAQPNGEVHLLAGNGRPPSGGGSLGAGSASPLDVRAVKLRLEGSADDVRRLARAVRLLASTRYGGAALADVLQREDVVLTLSDEIGLQLPTGHVLTTGGTALTEGKKVTLSRSRYGLSSPEVLAAMIAHELTHVAQNEASGTAWWQWPWTTVKREETAHLMQAVVWAELKGAQKDWEQDRNLESATNRSLLRTWIKSNPAYPWWLAPDLSC